MPTTKPTKSKLTDLLDALDTAFDLAETKREALAKISASASYEIGEAQKAFDAVKSEQTAKVKAASEATTQAQADLDAASKAVNERLGQSDPRVSVR